MAQQTKDAQLAGMDVTQWVKEGDRLSAAGELEKAADSYAQVIRQEPNQAVYHCKLGRVWLRLGRIDDALQCFEKALAINQESHLGLYGLAHVAAAREQWQEAVEKYKHLIVLLATPRPGWLAAVYRDLALALSKLKKWDESISCYQQLIQMEKSGCLDHQALGNALLASNRYLEAVASYQQAAALEPSHFQSHYSLGKLFFKLNRLKEAANAFKRAFELNVELFKADDIAALSCESVGWIERANLHWQRFIQENPESALASMVSRRDHDLAIPTSQPQGQKPPQTDDELSQENDLLLLQIHQVQEEIEFYFLKSKEQEAQLSQWKSFAHSYSEQLKAMDQDSQAEL